MDHYFLITALSTITFVILRWLPAKGFVYLLGGGIAALSGLILCDKVDGRMDVSLMYMAINILVFYSLLHKVATKGQDEFTIVPAISILFRRTAWAIIGTVLLVYFSIVMVQSGEGLQLSAI